MSLCPWAKPVHDRAALRFVHTEAACTESLFAGVLHEMNLLSSPECDWETTILVAPDAFPADFPEFNNFVLDCEEWLREEELDEQFQLVAFHPEFAFAGEEPTDAGNFVNRSPHPALHLLRQDDVTAAIDASEAALELPMANAKRLREIGAERMARELEAARRESS